MPKKILVIDDEPDVLQIVRAVLNTKGYDVVTAQGGEAGLNEFNGGHFDLVICDLMMPRISGLEVIKRLRKSGKLEGIPLIVLSALGDDEERNPDFWIRTLGVDDYVRKPFDPLDLLGRIEYVFRRSTYISSGAAPAERDVDPNKERRTSQTETHIPVDLTSAEPVEVVRTFIESWNRQDFATEFNCMGEEMIGKIDLHDYVTVRRQTYLEEKGQSRWQRLAEVIEQKISVNVAKVVVDREDVINNQTNRRRETYTLKKTHKGWKIIICRVNR